MAGRATDLWRRADDMRRLRSRHITQLLLYVAILPDRDIHGAAEYIEDLVLSSVVKEKSDIETPNELSTGRARWADRSDDRRRTNGDRDGDQTTVEPTAERRTVASQRAGKQMDVRDRPMV